MPECRCGGSGFYIYHWVLQHPGPVFEQRRFLVPCSACCPGNFTGWVLNHREVFEGLKNVVAQEVYRAISE